MDDELAELLATGERAAFHGRPSAGVAPLQRAVELAHGGGQDAEATAAVWLLGVCLASAGRYGAASAVLEPLAISLPEEPERLIFSSLAASSMASISRQLGRHAEGRVRDEVALDLAGEAPEARFDALLGLAADAVGLGEDDEAAFRLGEAADLVSGRPDWWRQRVRVDWVAAEISLLRDQPADAVVRAAGAVTLAETSGAPRHVAKGLLFQGVAEVQVGELELAAVTLRRAAGLAESLGTLPLVWPARAVLGALLTEAAPAEAAASLTAARAAVRQISEDLPSTLASDWLLRPDIAALLEG